MLNLLRFSLGSAAAVLLMSFAAAQSPAPAPAKPASTNASTNGPTNAPTSPSESQAKAVELLRQIIKEQQKHPDKIIRTPGDANAATAPAPAPAASREARSTPANGTNGTRPGRAELERQFLEGRITAKQYQRAMEDLERNPPPAVSKNSAKETPPAASSPRAGPGAGTATSAKPGTATAAVPTNPATAPLPVAEDAPEQKALSDVEAKIDEILARREAQLQAAKTNAANASSTNAVAGPLTKRQKLDSLLRQYIQGKLTEQEYNAQREKLVAQPD
jgi:hypothetical protein